MKLHKILANPCKYIEICLEHDLKARVESLTIM